MVEWTWPNPSVKIPVRVVDGIMQCPCQLCVSSEPMVQNKDGTWQCRHYRHNLDILKRELAKALK